MTQVSETPLDGRCPTGDIATRWDRHKFDLKLVAPHNKRKNTIIVVGTGLAGGSAAASLAELGYNVLSFCIQDTPRRAHSIAAQGGINAAKNYANDGDSVRRLFYDTVKGGEGGGRARATFIGWPHSARRSSISASRRACRSPVSTAARWRTARLAGHRFREPSTVPVKPDSSFCWVRIRP